MGFPGRGSKSELCDAKQGAVRKNNKNKKRKLALT